LSGFFFLYQMLLLLFFLVPSLSDFLDFKGLVIPETEQGSGSSLCRKLERPAAINWYSVRVWQCGK
jgi:hypothetical protein